MTTINIYYGGRGLIDDPTIYVMDKISKVFDELNVTVNKYKLYEDKRKISVLPKTLKEADAIVIAASVEWFGIGGLLQQFLDACWLYGDKEIIEKLYMMPVVLSTTYGEKEAHQTITKAWEILGGITCDGICAYVSSSVNFETDPNYGMLIEKKAENFYRTFTKKLVTFPSSSNVVIETSQAVKPMTLTPQESEELSMYVSDDNYVKKQKEDIEELTQLFKNLMDDDEEPNNEVVDNTNKSDKIKPTMLNNAPDNKSDSTISTSSLLSNIFNKPQDSDDKYMTAFKSHFTPIPGTAISFALSILDQNRTLVLDMDNSKLNCYYGEKEDATATIKATHIVIDRIISGELTLQDAFMAGALSAKGNFNILKSFDRIFSFHVL